MGKRLLAKLVLGFMGGFVVLISVASYLYPGGSFYDRGATAHSIWLNFLCDLLRQEGLNGRPNGTGAVVATIAMLLMVVGTGLFWFLARLMMRQRPRLGLMVATAGAASALGTTLVALLPSDRFGSLHTIAINLAVGPATIAAAGAIWGVVNEGNMPRRWRLFGLATFLVFGGAGAVFVHHTYFAGDHLILMPVMQRLAGIFSVAFICATAWRALWVTTESAA